MTIRTGDDQNVFWCDNCGAEVPRTRDNPFPILIHNPGCPDIKIKCLMCKYPELQKGNKFVCTLTDRAIMEKGGCAKAQLKEET